MRIKQINQQFRRDFCADFECENCGHIEKNKSGYDDSYFHTEIVPNMKCPKCGESVISLKADYRPLATKYPDGMQV